MKTKPSVDWEPWEPGRMPVDVRSTGGPPAPQGGTALRSGRHATTSLATVLASLLAASSLVAETSTAPHWAFQPIRNPTPPSVSPTTWARTPVDRFILERLEAMKAMGSDLSI